MLNKKNGTRKVSQRFLASMLLFLFVITPMTSLIGVELVTAIDVKAKELDTPYVLPAELLNEKPKTFPELEYKAFYDIELSNKYLDTLRDSYIALEYTICPNEYTPRAIEAMNREQTRLEEIIKKVEADIEIYTKWETEFPYTAKTYLFLRQNGFSRPVACAIIGNMMVEVGGNLDTADLRPEVYSEYIKPGHFYGLCQWSVEYYPQIAGASFETQLNFLLNNIESEFNTFGGLYQKGFTYNDFISMTDPAEAAFAFARVYERCADWSRDLRRPTAIKAFDYFKLTHELSYEQTMN